MRNNFRVMLVMCGGGTQFHAMCRDYPTLAKNVNFIWFPHWSKTQLIEHALFHVKVKNADNMKFLFLKLNSLQVVSLWGCRYCVSFNKEVYSLFILNSAMTKCNVIEVFTITEIMSFHRPGVGLVRWGPILLPGSLCSDLITRPPLGQSGTVATTPTQKSC